MNPVRVLQSTTLVYMSNNNSATLAVDGNMKTVSHTKCKYNELIWFRMLFNTELCFEKVDIYPSHSGNSFRYRMNGAKILVGKRGFDAKTVCGVLDNTNKTKQELYSFPCKACGNEIEVQVLHEQSKYSHSGCIHMCEIEAYVAGECPGGYYLQDKVCVPCSEGEYSPGGSVGRCEKCSGGMTTLAGAASKPSHCGWGKLHRI